MQPNISDHLTYREVIYSVTAVRNGINNTPSETQLSNIRIFAKEVFEPLRKIVSSKIFFDVIYRCLRLNRLVGGAEDSQHLCLGGDAAGDMDNDNHPDCAPNLTLFIVAYNNLEVNYDQLIAEDINDEGHVGWVHISHDVEKPKQRRQALVSFLIPDGVDEDGEPKMKRVYEDFDMTKGLIKSNYLK